MFEPVLYCASNR